METKKKKNFILDIILKQAEADGKELAIVPLAECFTENLQQQLASGMLDEDDSLDVVVVEQ